MESRKALKKLGIIICAEIVLVILIIFVFDPFYQYHPSFLGDRQPFYDRDYQVPGSIRTSTYDSVLLGSSVAENFDSTFLDEHWDCKTLKVIKASGSTADLLEYLEQAHQYRELSNVFWCMDIFALTAEQKDGDTVDKTMKHLYTASPLDDYSYIFNKDVLLMKIPQTLALAFMGKNIGGDAYNWAEGKTFSAEQAMMAYQKPGAANPSQGLENIEEHLEKNMERILEEIDGHPDVQYTVIFPPYSMLWWDCGYTNGIAEQYFYVVKKALPVLASRKNVKLYYFQHEKDIVCNLDNYMDMLHYAPEINSYMLHALDKDTYLVTPDNVDEFLKKMEDTYVYIINEGIYEYYPKHHAE